MFSQASHQCLTVCRCHRHGPPPPFGPRETELKVVGLDCLSVACAAPIKHGERKMAKAYLWKLWDHTLYLSLLMASPAISSPTASVVTCLSYKDGMDLRPLTCLCWEAMNQGWGRHPAPTDICIYIYIYRYIICVHLCYHLLALVQVHNVCVCVCLRLGERERERERDATLQFPQRSGMTRG